MYLCMSNVFQFDGLKQFKVSLHSEFTSEEVYLKPFTPKNDSEELVVNICIVLLSVTNLTSYDWAVSVCVLRVMSL